MFILKNECNILIFSTTIESEESIAKSSRMMQSCDTIRIAWNQVYETASKHKAFLTRTTSVEQASFKRPRFMFTVLFALFSLWRF